MSRGPPRTAHWSCSAPQKDLLPLALLESPYKGDARARRPRPGDHCERLSGRSVSDLKRTRGGSQKSDPRACAHAKLTVRSDTFATPFIRAAKSAWLLNHG